MPQRKKKSKSRWKNPASVDPLENPQEQARVESDSHAAFFSVFQYVAQVQPSARGPILLFRLGDTSSFAIFHPRYIQKAL